MLKVIESTTIKDFEKGPIRRSLFSNGATFLFHKTKEMSGAKVNLYFLAGSRFESVNEHGLSHVIEHMIFKETDTDFTKNLELAGAEINAYTYKEYVCFEMSCLGSSLKELLPDFLDLFLTLDFTPIQLEKEKKVIIQELKEDLDDHETFGFEYIFKKNFDAPLGHSIGGTQTQVKSYKESDVRNYYDQYYTPERMLLTIVSNDDTKSYLRIFEDAMKAHFIYKDKKPFRLKALNKVSKINHFRSLIQKKMESSILFLAFDGVTLNSKSYYDYAVLDEILFEGLSSIFFKKLRVEKPLVYGLGSSLNSFKDAGSYVMQFNCQKKNIKEVQAGVIEAIKSFIETPFEVSELDQIKKRIINNTLLAFDSIAQRADFISDNEIYKLNEISISSIQARVEKVDVKSIKFLAKKLISNTSSKLIMESKK